MTVAESLTQQVMRVDGRVFGLVVATAAMGCATVQPFVPSSAQQARFDEVVRQAEARISNGPPAAAALLADAKSDWSYAQHLPKYPERARAVADKAQHDAETALMMLERNGSAPARAATDAATLARPQR
jgi:hypothetical protein